uniref:Predicted gene 11077 n=1 Tax=Mus spicilegus TaxID=10103 RepID=A0A8C6HYW5_MUSSI
IHINKNKNNHVMKLKCTGRMLYTFFLMD